MVYESILLHGFGSPVQTRRLVAIPGVPEKRNGGFSVGRCHLKSVACFSIIHSDKASSFEKNDTKIIEWVWIYDHF